MTGYILRRLLGVVGVVAATTVLIFAIVHVLPGNVAYAILGSSQPRPRWRRLRRSWGCMTRYGCSIGIGCGACCTATSACRSPWTGRPAR